jgi:hypothetical protein
MEIDVGNDSGEWSAALFALGYGWLLSEYSSGTGE